MGIVCVTILSLYFPYVLELILSGLGGSGAFIYYTYIAFIARRMGSRKKVARPPRGGGGEAGPIRKMTFLHLFLTKALVATKKKLFLRLPYGRKIIS